MNIFRKFFRPLLCFAFISFSISVTSFLFMTYAFLFSETFIRAAEAKMPGEVWNLTELKNVPSAQWSEPVEKDGGILLQKVFYAGEEFNGHPTRVFAFFARPKGDGPFPGIVLVHGGGGTAFSEWAELWAREGYAAIAMDLSGCEVLDDGSRKRLEDGGPGQGDEEKFQFFEENDYKKMWTYHAVADIMRAHSLLRSLSCVDSDRTAATGISWGGYLTSMTAGIDDRFRVVVPVYGCGDLERNSVWTSRLESIPWPGSERWREYFDPIQYIGNAKCRLFFVAGTDDFAYPLDIHYNTYSRAPQSDVRLQVHMPHGHGAGWNPKEITAYVNSVLCGTPELPCLGKIEWKREPDGSISVSAPVKYNPAAVASASLHYTTDLGGYTGTKWNVREWSELSAELKNENEAPKNTEDTESVRNAKNTENSAENSEKVSCRVASRIPAEIAAKNPLRVYLDVKTADGLMVSSHYVLCKPVPKPDFQPVPDGGILLFGRASDGTLVNRFRDKSGAPANWTVENDTLTPVFENYLNHVHSDCDFRNAKIHVEFQLPKDGPGNSGIYIHGQYEMQILNSSGAREVNVLDAGAMYRFFPPETLACLPPGEWQSYDILYSSPLRDESGKIVKKGRLSAWLNGIQVQNNVEFEEPRSQWHPMCRQTTDCIQEKWEHHKKTGFGPLFLQDHNNPVKFRNVWILPQD